MMESNNRSAHALRFKASNFLSLKDFSLELGKLNILVGPNASGKSNIVKGFRIIATLAQKGPSGLADFLGVNELREIVFRHTEGLSPNLRLDININGKECSYEVSLAKSSIFEKVTVGGTEALKVKSLPSEALTEYMRKDGSICRSSAYGTTYYFTSPICHYHILASPPDDIMPEVAAISSFLQNIRSYSFEPTRIRPRISITTDPTLAHDGHNLARTLLYLYHEKRKVFSKIEDCLKSLIPEVEEVIPHIPLGTSDVQLKILEKGFKESLSPYLISDGTLRLLAFITAVHNDASFVTFEEPENCIHPHLLEALVDLLRKAPCQVLVTTHSPHLLNYVKPEEVVVVDKVNGETKAVRLTEHKEVEAVQNMLKEGLKIGDIWDSGIIGGVPKFA